MSLDGFVADSNDGVGEVCLELLSRDGECQEDPAVGRTPIELGGDQVLLPRKCGGFDLCSSSVAKQESSSSPWAPLGHPVGVGERQH